MTGSWNMAWLSPSEWEAIQADLIACRIRHQLIGMKGSERQKAEQELLAKAPAHLRSAVVGRLKARSSGSASLGRPA